MKKLTKIVIISTICVAIVAVGAWALTSVSFNATSRIQFSIDQNQDMQFVFKGNVWVEETEDFLALPVNNLELDYSSGAGSATPADWKIGNIAVTTDQNVVVYEFSFENVGAKGITVSVTSKGVNAALNESIDKKLNFGDKDTTHQNGAAVSLNQNDIVVITYTYSPTISTDAGSDFDYAVTFTVSVVANI